ncbi:16S rRNA (uracil(1498)-N(3))-methyltransferase [Diplocloster modestus]|uniref:Ribosomal RNA small subunit methyltransferase E n=1 Tax=Diplocloster modestus TaxID=2850322 RepID=A0ABS6KEY9_9FIRM|nr:16S rRNA (uracil(1498)-N(3))-methyltransferase [Diplocloster modestus]MBU9729056.1 16S rRNA (uracil(1498)-N(3))-methyltransferase [Diplocloster modestus]
MYHFFVNPEQIQESGIVILGTDVNHIRNVLRMKPGEKVSVSADGAFREYLCEISKIEPDCIRLGILSAEDENRELPCRITLFQGLPKSDKMELIIQKAVELGVSEVVPVGTRRTVVKLDAKKEQSKLKRWNAISESAAKQSGRMVIPKVKELMKFSDALAYAQSMDHVFIPYEHAQGMAESRELLQAVRTGQSVGVFIGPEGGFEEDEVQKACSLGASAVSLGKRILRTETAGLAILSVLMFQLECNDAIGIN